MKKNKKQEQTEKEGKGERANRREDGKRGALTATETIYFSLTARKAFVRVLGSSTDICQPTTPNYWPLPGEEYSQQECKNELVSAQ